MKFYSISLATAFMRLAPFLVHFYQMLFVAIKRIGNYLCKSCSALGPKMLVNLTLLRLASMKKIILAGKLFSPEKHSSLRWCHFNDA
jgi:hypothetical protein